MDINRYGVLGNGLTGYFKSYIESRYRNAVGVLGGGAQSYQGVFGRQSGDAGRFTLLSQVPIGFGADLLYEYYGSSVNPGARINQFKFFNLRGKTYAVAAVSEAPGDGGIPTARTIVICEADIVGGQIVFKSHLQTLIAPEPGTFYAYTAFHPTVADVDDESGTFTMVFNGYADASKNDYSIGSVRVTLC